MVLWAGKAADAEAMHLINSTGQLEWGAGGSRDQDASLLRGSGSTDGEMHFVIGGMISGTPNVYYGAFVVERPNGNGELLRVNTIDASTSPAYVVIINNAGGAATLDVEAHSTNYPAIRATQSTASAIIFRGRVGTESQPQFEIAASGKLFWGPGSSSGVDVSLARFVSGSNKGLQLVGGDLHVSDVGKGIILKSPDGQMCKRLRIDNSGNIAWDTVTCP